MDARFRVGLPDPGLIRPLVDSESLQFRSKLGCAGPTQTLARVFSR